MLILTDGLKEYCIQSYTITTDLKVYYTSSTLLTILKLPDTTHIKYRLIKHLPLCLLVQQQIGSTCLLKHYIKKGVIWLFDIAYMYRYMHNVKTIKLLQLYIRLKQKNEAVYITNTAKHNNMQQLCNSMQYLLDGIPQKV